MDKDKPRPPRRPDVLRKLNAENLHFIERGLIGELPEKLRPQLLIPVRGRPNDLAVVKHTGLLSSCLPIIPDSPQSEFGPTSSDDEQVITLRKSFSFREKFSRMSLFGKEKQKTERRKWKTIAEKEQKTDENSNHGHQVVKPVPPMKVEPDNQYKNSKRFWLFRNKEVQEKKQQRHSNVYVRSKSFEFLPKAIEEEEQEKAEKPKGVLRNSISYVFGSSDSLDDWGYNEELEYPSNVYYDNDDGVFLKSIKEFPASESSTNNSSMSLVTSTSSGIVVNMFKTQSVQDILNEFNKAVELFSESYMSDCEPYTKSGEVIPRSEKRKSSSYSTLPSPKVMQVDKPSEISADFKVELSRVLSEKRKSGIGRVIQEEVRSSSGRRGSVTDWFVLEDQAATVASEANKYRRAQRKPANRVRRMSSTKYWITPEECAAYSREQRPPLVIPRITQYRTPRREPKGHHVSPYQEDSIQESAVKSSVRQYDRLQDYSPVSERSRADLERSFHKANSDSPSPPRLNARLGNSTENLLAINRRPHHLQLPASSSGDSLDVELRDRELGFAKSRKSHSMMAPKHHLRSPVPAPRTFVPQQTEPQALHEAHVKRAKFSENGKKCKKQWHECYMTLTPTALVFYSNFKTYRSTLLQRPPGTPPSPSAPRAELVLPLRNAHVVPCLQVHTKRYTRSIALTVGYDVYLLQDETDEGAKKWLMYIQDIIYKLGPPKHDDVYSQHYYSSNTDLESLGRTPPAARHANRNKQKAGGSSNEDLSDSTEASIQKSHVRSILRKFFPKRPPMDVLVKKGIYKDEPVFGRKLEEVCPTTTSPRVPEFVRVCVEEIESSEENMCTDGLYRASGNLSQVQKIRLEIDQNNISVIKNNTDIHVLTGSLKLFFRELKEPLIPCTLFDRVLAACSIKPREAKIKEFRDIVHALPQCNRDTLKYLLEHLLRVTQYSERNRMHTANLAIVFGPTLLWAPAEQAHNIAIDCIQQNNVVDILLNEFRDIFADDHQKGKKKA